MATDPLLRSVRRAWVELAAAPVAFTDSAVSVAISPRSSLCPPGWVGIVVLGGAAIVTAPDRGAAQIVERAVAALPRSALAALTVVLDRLPLAEVLGPAALAYCDRVCFRPTGTRGVDIVPADHVYLEALLAGTPEADTQESGIAEITSPAFVLQAGSAVLAAAGYRRWPNGVAHLSVLTAESYRGRGLARIVASAAVSHALDQGLLPQWRARRPASRRVAQALGFRDLGSQASIHLLPPHSPPEGASPTTRP